MGRGIVETGLGRTERLELEQRTSDPTSTKEGEAWLRTDLAPATDQIATVRFDNGSGTWDIPVFDDAATVENVEKVLRIPVAGTVGFVPVTTASAAFPDLGFQHNGSRHGLHDSLTASAIPDSVASQGVNYWPIDEGSGTTLVDAIGSSDLTIQGGTRTTGVGEGDEYVDLDGTDDDIFGSHTGALDLSNAWTILGWFRIDAVLSSTQTIFAWDDTSTSEFLTAGFDDGNGGRWFFGSDGRTGNITENSINTTWAVTGVAHDGAGGLRIIHEGTTVHTDNSGSASWLSGLNETYIGSDLSTGTYLGAGVDQPWYADSELSDSEVQTFINETEDLYP
jgi:hypothetical protein